MYTLLGRHTTIKIFDAVVVAIGGNEVSEEIDLSVVHKNALFSLEVWVTGDGTCKFEEEVSNSGVTFYHLIADILAAQTKITGPDGDGRNMAAFAPTAAQFLRVRCTETGGANTVTVSAWLKILF